MDIAITNHRQPAIGTSAETVAQAWAMFKRGEQRASRVIFHKAILSDF
jgi:hypothetical protein